MKMTAIQRRAYKIYDAFEKELLSTENMSEVKSNVKKMLDKFIQLYIKHRDSNDIKGQTLVDVKSEINQTWNFCAGLLSTQDETVGLYMKPDAFIHEILQRKER